MGDSFRATLKPLNTIECFDMMRVVSGAQLGPHDCRETLFSRTAIRLIDLVLTTYKYSQEARQDITILHLHREKSSRNLINPNQIWIVITIFR